MYLNFLYLIFKRFKGDPLVIYIHAIEIGNNVCLTKILDVRLEEFFYMGDAICRYHQQLM